MKHSNTQGSGFVFAAVVAMCTLACQPPDLCDASTDATPTPSSPSPLNGLRFLAHAHNDYEHPRPLQDALAAGFTSVEADVWFRDGEVIVSHDAFTSAGTLEDLYLAPLAVRLRDRDTIHDDGAPFTLWLDLKDSTPELREGLAAALAARDYLTRFDDDGLVEERAVTVILTGDAGSKTALVAETAAPRHFARDDNGLSVDDLADPTVVASALNFGGFLGGWNGVDDVPDDLSRRCACVVDRAHRLGRGLRFFSGPDTEAAWTFQLEHGVDFINTDDLVGLATFLEDRSL